MISVSFELFKKIMSESVNRKIIIYGTNDLAREAYDKLRLLDVEIAYFVDEDVISDMLKDIEVRQPVCLLYEDLNKIFVLVVEAIPGNNIQIYMKLLEMGLPLSCFLHFFNPLPDIKKPAYPDVTLTYNRFDDLFGFTVFGEKENEEALKIVTLGGSTTDAFLYDLRSWSDFLSEELKVNHIPATVYCGGISGYNSSQELLKLVRDALPLKPDIILSYSGYNDIGQFNFRLDPDSPLHKRPFMPLFQVDLKWSLILPKHKDGEIFYGLQSDLSPALHWVHNMRMMHAVCKEFGIVFRAFFQPSLFTKKCTGLELHFFDLYAKPHDNPGITAAYSCPDFYPVVKSLIEKKDYILDFTGLFDNYSDVYIDIAHVNEKGNKIIAENIYQEIVEDLKKCIEVSKSSDADLGI